jgi:WD40 repeat protein
MNDDVSRIWVINEEGTLHGLDRVNGQRFAVQAAPPGFAPLALSIDQQHVVCGGSDGKLSLIATENGALLRHDDTKLQKIQSLCWSPDGTRLAIAGDDLVVLWNPITHDVSATLRGHSGTVSDVSFSLDGSRLLSASSDGTVRIWDVASARTLLVLDTRSGGLRSARMSSDERELITTGNDGRVITWLALEPQSWD